MSDVKDFPMDIQISAGKAIAAHSKSPGAALGNYDHMHWQISNAILNERLRVMKIVGEFRSAVMDNSEIKELHELIAEGFSEPDIETCECCYAITPKPAMFCRVCSSALRKSADVPRAMETAPQDGTWIVLHGISDGEPKAVAAFWGDGDDWFDSEAASKPVTAFGWVPTHWTPFIQPGT